MGLMMPQEPQGGGTQIYCISDGEDEIWPSRFVECPRMGDFVRSLKTDRTLKVIQVTHMVSKAPPFAPMIEIQLASDRTSVTPESGV